MKKRALFIFTMVLTANSYAFTPYHIHHKGLSQHGPVQTSRSDEDFTGRWIGSCADEPLELTMTQDNKNITIGFSDNNTETESISFDINQLVSHHSSASSTNRASLNNAFLFGNILDLTSIVITTTDHGLYTESMGIFLVKEGNTLTLRDAFDEVTCSLTKAE